MQIPPKPPPDIPPSLRPRVRPVEKISTRHPAPPVPDADQERRRGDRRGQSRPRLKGYDMRTGRDRRKNPRPGKGIDIDV